MRLQDLPHSTPIAFVTNEQGLVDALARILRDPERDVMFESYDIVSGAPCSARVLYTLGKNNGVELPYAYGAEKMAEEIHNLRGEARYPPIKNPELRFNLWRGWEVRLTCHKGYPAAIVLATWVNEKDLKAA